MSKMKYQYYIVSLNHYNDLDNLPIVLYPKFTSYEDTTYNYFTKLNTTSENTRWYGMLKYVFLHESIYLNIGTSIPAGTLVTLGTMDSGLPGIPMAISVYVNSSSTRRYMGYIKTDGTINIRCNEAMEAGIYYVYIQSSYVVGYNN